MHVGPGKVRTIGPARAISSQTPVGSAGRSRPGLLPLLGPAFVTAVAYVDPGNFATNVSAGARYGYLLVWVVVVSNLMAMLIQYLSAKAGVATGRSLPALCREHLPRPVTYGLWLQAQVVAVATDLAEVVGGAIALKILFDVPLVIGGSITAIVAFTLLLVRGRGHRSFEGVVVGLLGVILVGFVFAILRSGFDLAELGHGTVPRFAGGDSVLLAAGMLGATVMPHAIYLHGALTSRRFVRRTEAERKALVASQRVDVITAMSIAGLMNLVLLVVAAATLSGSGVETIAGAHAALGSALGPAVALMFAIALLASGFAASSVGTLSGQVVMEGFLRLRVPLVAQRLVTLVPALVVLGVGVDPTRALVVSQVVLSFGIPFALVPLVMFTRRRDVMGTLVNHPITTGVAAAVAAVIVGLNGVLLWQTLLG